MMIVTTSLISLSGFVLMDSFNLSKWSDEGSARVTVQHSKILAYQVAAMYQQGLLSSKFNQKDEQKLALRGPASVSETPEYAGKIGRDSWGAQFEYQVIPVGSGSFKVIISSLGKPGYQAPITTELEFAP